MKNQTKFKFNGEWYVFWLVYWVDVKKGPMLLRCEEYQSPVSKLELLKSERAVAYQTGDTGIDRLQTPFDRIEPCTIGNSSHAARISGWMDKFAAKNGFEGLMLIDGVRFFYFPNR